MTDALVNIEGEQELLGLLLSNNPLLDSVADLVEAHDFAEPLHQRIYETALDEAMKGRPASPVTLKGLLADDPRMKEAGGPQYLANLTSQSIYALSPATDLAKHVRELSLRRFMRDGLQEASTHCGDLAISPNDIIDLADHALAIRTKDHIHQPTGAECLDELLDSYQRNETGVTSGIRSLDDLIGPLRPKQLVIGAGRPGMGKTALALSYALGVAQKGRGVLFVSLEMSSQELAARMAADLCFGGPVDIPFNCIRDNRLNADQRRRIAEAGSFMRGLPFQVIDAGSLTTGRLSMLVRRHARRMAAKGNKLELVIVDYLQLLSPDGRRGSAYEAVSEVSRNLKGLAKDNGVAVMALAQLSREVEKRTDKRPMLSDLRDSGQIEQDADAVLFLLRPEYYLKQAEPDQLDPDRAKWEHAMAQARGIIEFILAKRRNGTTGSATGEFHGAYQAVRG
jgi:replicative DNA helicase